jgi:hypothetical protein
MTYKSEKLQSAVRTVFFCQGSRRTPGRSDYGKQGCPVREPAAPPTLVDLKLHIPHAIELASVGKPSEPTLGLMRQVSTMSCPMPRATGGPASLCSSGQFTLTGGLSRRAELFSLLRTSGNGND